MSVDVLDFAKADAAFAVSRDGRDYDKELERQARVAVLAERVRVLREVKVAITGPNDGEECYRIVHQMLRAAEEAAR